MAERKIVSENELAEFLQSANVKEFVESYKKINKSDCNESEILLDFVVAFLAQNKTESPNESKDKYVYLVPEAFLCWALFEYSYYNYKKDEYHETAMHFIKKTLNYNKLGLIKKLEKHNKCDLIREHYEAYKFLAGNAKTDICDHLRTNYLNDEIKCPILKK